MWDLAALFRQRSRSFSQSPSPSPGSGSDAQDLVANWFDEDASPKKRPARGTKPEPRQSQSPSARNLADNWFDEPQQAKKPALVSQVCFCIFFLFLIVFVS